MRKSFLIAAAATSVVAIVGVTAASAMNGPMAFTPISASAYDQQSANWDVPLVAPKGFKQTLVRDETQLDVFPGADDLTDMNTVNENGRQAGRYLYSTTEVGSNGAVTTTDLHTKKHRILIQFVNGVLQTVDPDGTVRTLNANGISLKDFRRLDGLRWTPWGTLLFAEETGGGRLFEAKFKNGNPTVIESVVERPALGILRHEGIEALPNGTVYVIDELNGGSIFKFVPKRRGDLSEGQLYALKLNNLTAAQQKYNNNIAVQNAEKVGAFSWVALDMNQVKVDADAAANAVSATEFGRPEDVEFIGDTLYVANTSENRVVAINESTKVMTSFVEAGKNAPVENQATKVTGFAKPDNLAQGPDGRLWIVEDNDFSDIWVADRDRNGDGTADKVELFASLKDKGAEVSGIYFGKDPKTLFFNVQHPDKPLADGTWKITKTNSWDGWGCGWFGFCGW